jgi:hypothetical protein
LLLVVLQGSQSLTVLQLLYVLRLGRLLRLVKLGQLLQQIEAGLGISLPRVLVFIVLALLLMHVEACLFILVAVASSVDELGTWLEGAGKKHGNMDVFLVTWQHGS